MNLSPHFTYAEAIRSQTAVREGINNIPSADEIEVMKHTAAQMECVRSFLLAKYRKRHPDVLDLPIDTSSWFRCQALERALKRKPESWVSNSQHARGEAVDWTSKFGTPYEVCCAIRDSDIPFDQLIHEFGDQGWVHISFGPRNRRECLTICPGGGYQSGILPCQ